jgi:hypothetical protein
MRDRTTTRNIPPKVSPLRNIQAGCVGIPAEAITRVPDLGVVEDRL